MPIDWFTVVAQAINFLILVWLLKRFLYGPILKAIDQREQEIAAQLAMAQKKTEDADRQQASFQQKSDAIDQQRASLLAKAADEASAERQRLLDEARRDADTLRSKRQAMLQNERLSLAKQINDWTQTAVFNITRSTLKDLADLNVEDRICERFLVRLRALADSDKVTLAAALTSSNDAAIVRSAFELSPKQQQAIEAAIKDLFQAEPSVLFETTPELIGGVEFVVNGQHVGWSISEHLTLLEKNVEGLLDRKSSPNEQAINKTHENSTSATNRVQNTQLEPVSTAPKAGS